jgi:hypothetical protein
MSDDEVADMVAGNWERFARLQRMIWQGLGVPHLQIIQPNQYIPNSKPLSEKEQQLYYKPENKEDMLRNYQRIILASQKLRNEGVPSYDFTRVFSQHGETIYNDDCCHFNDLGYDLFEKEIFRVLDKMNLKRKQRISSQ